MKTKKQREQNNNMGSNPIPRINAGQILESSANLVAQHQNKEVNNMESKIVTFRVSDEIWEHLKRREEVMNDIAKQISVKLPTFKKLSKADREKIFEKSSLSINEIARILLIKGYMTEKDSFEKQYETWKKKKK